MVRASAVCESQPREREWAALEQRTTSSRHQTRAKSHLATRSVAARKQNRRVDAARGKRATRGNIAAERANNKGRAGGSIGNTKGLIVKQLYNNFLIPCLDVRIDNFSDPDPSQFTVFYGLTLGPTLFHQYDPRPSSQ